MALWNPDAMMSDVDRETKNYESLITQAKIDRTTLRNDVVLSAKKNPDKLSALKASPLYANAITIINKATEEDKKSVLEKLKARGEGDLSESAKELYPACVIVNVAHGGDGHHGDTLETATELFVKNIGDSVEEGENEQSLPGPDNYDRVADIYKQNGRSGEAICSDFALAEFARLYPDRYIKIRNFGDSWNDDNNTSKAGGTRDMLTKLGGQYKDFFSIDQPSSWTQDTFANAKPGTMLTVHNPTSNYKFKPGTEETTKETQVTHVLIKGHNGKRKDWYAGKIREIETNEMTISQTGEGEFSSSEIMIAGKSFLIHPDSRLYIPKIENMPKYKATTINFFDPKLYPPGKVPQTISGTYLAQVLADRYHMSKSYISQVLLAQGYGLTTKYNLKDLSVDNNFSIDLVIPPKTVISHEYGFTAPESHDLDIQGKITKIRQYASDAKISESRTENLVAIFLKENAGGWKKGLAKGFYHELGGSRVGNLVRKGIDQRRRPDSFGMFQIAHKTFENTVRLPILKSGADQATKNRYDRENKRIEALRSSIEQSYGKSINRDTICTGPMDDDKKFLIETLLKHNRVSFLLANELQLQTENIFSQHLRHEYDGSINGDDLALTSLVSHNLGIPRTHALIGQQNLFALSQKLGIDFDRKTYVSPTQKANEQKRGVAPVNLFLDGIWGEESKNLFEAVKATLCVDCPFEMIGLDENGNEVNVKTESGQTMYTHIRYGDKKYSLTDHAVSSPSGMKALFAQLVVDCEECTGFDYTPGLSVSTLKKRQESGTTHLHYAGEFLDDFISRKETDNGSVHQENVNDGE